MKQHNKTVMLSSKGTLSLDGKYQIGGITI